MKNKNITIAVLCVVIVVILSLIAYIFVNNNNDSKKDNNKKDNEVTATLKNEYELEDRRMGSLILGNIKINVSTDQTIVRFSVKNNGSEIYPEGEKVFSIEEGNVPVEEISNYISALEPGDMIDIEVVLNGSYYAIDAINIKE